MSQVTKNNSHLVRVPDWRGRSSSDRVKLIKTAFVFHPQCAAALDTLQIQFFISGGGGAGRLILLTGEHGCGKSEIIRRLVSEHPRTMTDKIDQQPIVVTTPTENLSARGLAAAIIQDAEWPLKGKFRDEKMCEKAVFHVLAQSNTRLLVINKANLLLEDRESIAFHTEPFLVSLLVNGVSIVLVGDATFADRLAKTRSILNYLSAHSHLEPITDPNEWRAVSTDFEKQLPFEETELLLGEMPEQTLLATGGKLPHLARLTELAATAFFWPKSGPRNGECLRAAHFHAGFGHMYPHCINPFDANWKDLLLQEKAATRLKAATGESSQWRTANRGD